MKSILYSIILFFLLSLNLNVRADEEISTVEIFSETKNIASNKEFFLALKFKMQPGYHSYWLNPGDVGMELQVLWDKNEQIEFSDFLWPVPTKLMETGLYSFAYEEDFTLLVPVKTGELNLGDKYKIQAQINWLVCKDICVPIAQQVGLTLRADEELEVGADLADYKARIPHLEEEEIEFNFDQNNLWLKLPKKKFYFHNKNVGFFPESHGFLDYKQDAEIFEKGAYYYLVSSLLELPELDRFKAVIAEDINFWRANLKLNSALELPTPELPFDWSVFLIYLLFAFVGGVILNLMPCVFPVLSLKALHIAKSSAIREKKIKAESFSYSLGVILSFVLLSFIIIILKYLGYEIGWGFQMQSPVFVSFLALLFFVIGLNLSGFVEINFYRITNLGSSLAGSNSNSASFFTGFMATTVATPCTVPFMATAVGFALSHSPFVIIATFIVLGLGLSMPILCFAFFPRLTSLLPKPGRWLETFRQFLAFPIFLTTIWLLFILSALTDIFNVLWLQILFIYLGFCIWLISRIEGKIVLKIATFLGLIYFLVRFYTAITTIMPIETVQRLSESKKIEMINHYRNSGQKMFINVTADWCITCKVNEQAAMKPLFARKFFAKNDIKYIELDWTKSDQDITLFLKSFERSGVPLYLYVDENGAAQILPQLLTPSIISAIIVSE